MAHVGRSWVLHLNGAWVCLYGTHLSIVWILPMGSLMCVPVFLIVMHIPFFFDSLIPGSLDYQLFPSISFDESSSYCKKQS
jgi:hypothetical protein